MTDAASQFYILCTLCAVGAAAGTAIAATSFIDDCLGGRPVLRFFAEFFTVCGAGTLVWITVIYLNGGVFRAFFVLPVCVFAVIFLICMRKLLNPLETKFKQAFKLRKKCSKRGFIAKYLLK